MPRTWLNAQSTTFDNISNQIDVQGHHRYCVDDVCKAEQPEARYGKRLTRADPRSYYRKLWIDGLSPDADR